MLPVNLFWKDKKIYALTEDGEFVPLVNDTPSYKNGINFISWRLRDGSKPEIADGELWVNYIIVGDKIKLQISLKSGPHTVIPANDGWLFVISRESVLCPSAWSLVNRLGGIGQVKMISRDNGDAAGNYVGTCRLIEKLIDGKLQPCISVDASESTHASHSAPISAVFPFNWRSAQEGGNCLDLEIEYERKAVP